MSTYELNFGMPYAVSTASIYLKVLQPVLGDRHYVIGVKALAGDTLVELATPGWHFSSQLQTTFCYMPPQEQPGVIRLPALTIGREISRIEIEPRAWARGVQPIDEIVAGVWAAMPETGGGSTIFQVTAQQEGAQHV